MVALERVVPYEVGVVLGEVPFEILEEVLFVMGAAPGEVPLVVNVYPGEVPSEVAVALVVGQLVREFP